MPNTPLQLDAIPLVSVIVRTVDRPDYLRECLGSIAVQNYPNLEVIIVNDGGPPLKQLVERVSLPFPFQLVELIENRGRSYSGNIGIANANGEYLCFIDDDDIFYPFHISTLINNLIKTNYKVAYSDALQATQTACSYNEKIYTTIELNLVLSETFEFQDLLQRNFIPILTAVFHKSCIQQGCSFDINMEVLEDWDFWIQIAQNHDFLHIREITCEYRYRKDGTNTVGQMEHLWNWSRSYIKQKYQHLVNENAVKVRELQS